MPTILRTDGLGVYFYSHEPSEPPHVHVDRGGASAKVRLDGIVLASNAGFSAKELGDVLRMVRKHRQQFVEAWHGFFGPG